MGALAGLGSVIYYREVIPFCDPLTNFLAVVSQYQVYFSVFFRICILFVTQSSSALLDFSWIYFSANDFDGSFRSHGGLIVFSWLHAYFFQHTCCWNRLLHGIDSLFQGVCTTLRVSFMFLLLLFSLLLHEGYHKYIPSQQGELEKHDQVAHALRLEYMVKTIEIKCTYHVLNAFSNIGEVYRY